MWRNRVNVRVMRRKFISLLVAVLIGALPVAHEICLAGCSGKAASTAHSHHHDSAGRGAQGPEHQMAGHAMDQSPIGMTGHHHGPAAVGEMTPAAPCCASVSVAPRCCRSGDDSTPLVSTVKRVLDPPQTAVAQVIAILGPAAGDHPVSFVNTVIHPRVSLARLTPLRI